LIFNNQCYPFSQIPNYIKQKVEQKEKLEEEIKNLERKIEKLILEQSDRESLRDQALHDERMTATELKWYPDIKAELRKYGISVDYMKNY